MQYALVYIYDVIIYSKTLRDRFGLLTTVQTLLCDADLKLKLKKCTLFHHSVVYFGHVIRPEKLEVPSKNVEALKQARLPRTKLSYGLS